MLYRVDVERSKAFKKKKLPEALNPLEPNLKAVPLRESSLITSSE